MPSDPKAMTSAEQEALWVAGTSVHRGVRGGEGECCPDFSCCKPELKAGDGERSAFQRADGRARDSMLATFLGRALALMGEEKVYIAGDPANYEDTQ